MSDYMALNAVQGLSDQLVAVRVSFKVAEFLKLVQTQGTTSANIQAWLTANPDEVQNIFYNATVVKMLLSNTAWSALIYGSVVGAREAMLSPTWMADFITDPKNADVLMVSPRAIYEMSYSSVALDAIYLNKSNASIALYNRLVALSDLITYRPGVTNTNVTRAVPALSGRHILLTYRTNAASTGMRTDVTGKVLGAAPEMINAPSENVVTETFAAYTATSITPRSLSFLVSNDFFFNVISVPNL